jgi:hypothetical protein
VRGARRACLWEARTRLPVLEDQDQDDDDENQDENTAADVHPFLLLG